MVIEPDGRLRHPEASVDVVLSLQVLEHAEDVERYLLEAQRILKPGGLLWLTTHGMWPYHPTPDDYHRWTLTGLRRLVGRHFRIEETDALMGAPAYAVMIYLQWLWEASLRLNALQARALNALTRSQRWGKSGPREGRVRTPFLYSGFVAASILSVPLNVAIAVIDTLTPATKKQTEAAVFRIAARKVE
ncbi:MAG: class I SAM-dependent methyltransferase [Candidatus Omnitrophica bacterium]|nr:class I SAM-dependent methyltransferase [Candidatus Omnitrophota bacterium]